MAAKTLSFTTSSVTAGGSLAVNQALGVNRILILEITIAQGTPVGGTHSAAIYSTDGFTAGDYIWKVDSFSGTMVDPVENDSGTITARKYGLIGYYEDEDATKELHFKIWNEDAADKAYTVTVIYEEMAAITSGIASLSGLTVTGSALVMSSLGVGTLSSMNYPFFVHRDGAYTDATNIPGAQVQIRASANAMQILAGVDHSAAFGYIQAALVGTDYKPLILNPHSGGTGAYVGVGTITPSARFTVAGTGVFASGLRVTGGSAIVSGLHVANSGIITGALAVGALFVSGTTTGPASALGLVFSENIASARSTGSGQILFADATDRFCSGFLKVYISGAAWYIPLFAAN